MFPLQQVGSIIILTMADLKLLLELNRKQGPDWCSLREDVSQWARCSRTLCSTGITNPERSLYHRFIWMKQRLRMLTTANTFSGCSGYIKIILKCSEEHYLIH